MNEFYHNGLINANTYLYFCIKYNYKLPNDDEINKLYLNNEIPDYIYIDLCKNHNIKKLSDKILFNKIKSTSPSSDSTLMDSIKLDNLYGVKQVFNEISEKQKYYALNVALNNNNYKIFKYLVEHGADIHGDDEHLLLEAIKNNNIKIVKLLVEHGADIHINNERPLYWACTNYYYNIFKYLIEHGAQITNDIIKCAYKNNNNNKMINIIQNYDKKI
jgi:ankyrin repeat protein